MEHNAKHPVASCTSLEIGPWWLSQTQQKQGFTPRLKVADTALVAPLDPVRDPVRATSICAKCGSATVPAMIVDGWQNHDCSVCGAVTPVPVDHKALAIRRSKSPYEYPPDGPWGEFCEASA